MRSNMKWHIKGLLFENCSCQLICPAHISFKNVCNHDRCRGHWAFHIDEGRVADVILDSLNIVVVFDSPVQMHSGNWTQVFFIDERATEPQRDALEMIFSGKAGGPWEILAKFVSNQLTTRVVPMQFEDTGKTKRLLIPDMFETTVSAIRGSDGDKHAVLSNLHNVIHGPEHVLAHGKTRCTDSDFNFVLQKTHGLYSNFSWTA